VPAGPITPSTPPPRQLSDLPKDELEALAEEFGLDPTKYKTRQHLVAGIHDRRQLIASIDRAALMDVIRWGRRPVPANATKEQLAQEIVRIKSMRFSGLSPAGLLALAVWRRVPQGPTVCSRRSVVPWVVLALLFGGWELTAAVWGNNSAHPTFSLLLTPVLETYPGRVVGWLTWLGVGRWLVSR